MRKTDYNLTYLYIGIIIVGILAVAIFFTPQVAFGSNPRIVHRFNSLGLLNLTGINLNNVDEGRITIGGCDSLTSMTIQPIPATIMLDKFNLASIIFSNRCIVNDIQQQLQPMTVSVDLQKSMFSYPNLTMQKGTQNAEFKEFEVIEKVQCLVDKDCASVRRLDLGSCNIQNKCVYSDIIRENREQQKLNLFEKIILALRKLFNLKAI